MRAGASLVRVDGGRLPPEPVPRPAPEPARPAEVAGVVTGPLRFRLTHGPDGPWRVEEAAGRCGGLFVSEAAALKFMREEAETVAGRTGRPAAVHHARHPPLPRPCRFGY